MISENKILVEQCVKVKIQDLLKIAKEELKKIIISSELEALNINIKLTTSKTYFNGVRIWLVCPECEKRIGVLYRHPVSERLGCRQCLNLDYRKHRFKGMIEDIKLS